MRPVRSRTDVGRLGAAVSRPGIDPRVWLTLAVVTELGFDEAQGIFADVIFQPDGTPETAAVSAACAGGRFGSWRPLKVDDTVLVAVPMGDNGAGPIIIARLWNGGDPPAAAFGNGQDPAEDWIDIVEPGKSYILRTSDDGTIQLQGATQSFVRGDDQKAALDAFANAMKVWIGLVQTGIDTGGGTLVNTAFETAIDTLKNDLANALSSKIKGE